MARCVLLLAFLSLGFAPLPFPKPPKPAGDGLTLEALQGKWERVKLLIDNAPRAGEKHVTIAGGVMAYATPGDHWRLEFDPGPGTRTYTKTNTTSGSKGYGLCRLEGDTLTMCFRDGGDESIRPTSFDPAQKGVWFQVYKRVK
ncbi:MAG: hypothetical protein K2W96_04360 [Gemmataceae bacterium]|nr:hypothetical protein [Gemmataceae bacterium]